MKLPPEERSVVCVDQLEDALMDDVGLKQTQTSGHLVLLPPPPPLSVRSGPNKALNAARLSWKQSRGCAEVLSEPHLCYSTVDKHATQNPPL